MSGPNRIDSTQTSTRTSTNLSVPQQSGSVSFGARLDAGLQNATNTLAQGVQAAAPFVPGGAIVSAAVSSVTSMSHAATGGAVSATYAGGGIMPVGGGNGGINTTVGPNAGMPPGMVPSMTTQLPGLANAGPAGAQSGAGMMNSELMTSQRENMEMLKVQIAMQRENQMFTTVSNVLKTRHETVKGSISNIR